MCGAENVRHNQPAMHPHHAVESLRAAHGRLETEFRGPEHLVAVLAVGIHGLVTDAARIALRVHRVQGVVEEGSMDEIFGAVVFRPEPSHVDVVRGRVVDLVPFEARPQRLPPLGEGGLPPGAAGEEAGDGPGESAVDGWSEDKGPVSAWLFSKAVW